MITSINADNVKKYSVLFNKATAKLGTDISSLNEYFGHLRELLDAEQDPDKYIQYVKLPLDEECFVIDANSRKISIPTNFQRNGIGVIGDHTAEVIYFQVDRFFDAIDLGGGDVEIIIQWEGPNNVAGLSRHCGKIIDNVTPDGNLQSFMTEEEIENISVLSQKLIFGWIIDNRMTTAAGRIRFAIHFLKKDGNGNLTYAFNTLPADLIVNSTLVLDGTETAADLTENFYARITSNGIYSLGSDIPTYPNIINKVKAIQVYRPNTGAGGYDFDDSTKLFEENSDSEGDYDLVPSGAIFNDGKALNLQDGDIVVLRTNAVTEKGKLSYQWKHDENYLTSGRYNYDPVSYTAGGLDITALNQYFYETDRHTYVSFPYVGHFAFKAVNNNAIRFNDEDYLLYTRSDNVGSETGTAHLTFVPVDFANIQEGHVYYKEIDETTHAKELVIDNSEITSDDNIFEQFADYILEYSDTNGAYIGEYTADVACFTGINTKVNRGNDKVEITGPKTPVVEDNNTVATEANNVYQVLLDDNAAELKIKDANDNEGANVHVNSYQWQSSTDNGVTFESITGATSSSYNISGATADDYNVFYKCEVTASKHGASATATSDFTYRVTQPAAAPTFDITEDIDREINVIGNMTSINLQISVPLTDNTPGLPYRLIKENIDTSEATSDYHILTLDSRIINELGITPDNIKVKQGNALTTTDVIVKQGVVASGDTLTLEKVDFNTVPGYYRVLVINTVNGNTNYSVSGVIHITQG